MLRIYNKELKPLYPTSTKLGDRKLRMAASYLAQAQMVMDQIKADDKVSPKRHVMLVSRAEWILSRLRETEALDHPADSLAALLAEK